MSRIKTLFAVSLLAAGCGGPSPTQQCKDIMSAICQLIFTCDPQQAPQFGANQADCAVRLANSGVTFSEIQFPACGTINDANVCGTGVLYHPDKAGACASDIRNTSCSSTTPLINCQKICQ